MCGQFRWCWLTDFVSADIYTLGSRSFKLVCLVDVSIPCGLGRHEGRRPSLAAPQSLSCAKHFDEGHFGSCVHVWSVFYHCLAFLKELEVDNGSKLVIAALERPTQLFGTKCLKTSVAGSYAHNWDRVILHARMSDSCVLCLSGTFASHDLLHRVRPRAIAHT